MAEHDDNGEEDRLLAVALLGLLAVLVEDAEGAVALLVAVVAAWMAL